MSYAPVGTALIAVGKDIIKTGHLIYMRIPSEVTWKVITDEPIQGFWR